MLVRLLPVQPCHHSYQQVQTLCNPRSAATCLATPSQDLSRKPPYGSCRAGGVVQMMTASGNKVPVTLRMSSREHVNLDGEDSGGMMHVVQVSSSVSPAPYH